MTRRQELAKLPIRPQRGRVTLTDLAWELDVDIEGLRKCDAVELLARAEERRNGS